MSDDTLIEHAQLLMQMFPGQPHRHLTWIGGGESGVKVVREFPERASLSNYRLHLNPSSLAGPGALGVMPGIKTGSIWRTPWAMLDFDERTPAQLETYLELLARHDLNFKFTTGTTGRGTHVWFLLNKAIRLRQAVESLTFLKRVAQEMGGGQIDLRPGSPHSRLGSGILLPYRGGGANGYGANPFFDIEDGTAISVKDLPSLPLQSAKSFAALAQLSNIERFVQGPAQRPVPIARLESVLEADQSLWSAALDQLAGLWTPGRRHHLTLGATAFGVQQGVPHEQIVTDLMAVITASGDEQGEQRHQTILDSLSRASRGELLAYRPFYESAGVRPPATGGLPETRELVGALLATLMDRPWRGRGGKTDRSLLKALLELAWWHGRVHPQGVEVPVAWSQLEDDANIGSSSTISQSIQRLETADWIRRAGVAKGTHSGSFVILAVNKSTPIGGGAMSQGQALEEYFSSAPHLRYGRGRLGKLAEQIIDLVLWHGPLSAAGLAGRLETKLSDLQRAVRPLREDGLIVEVQEGGQTMLHVPGDLNEKLEQRQIRDESQVARESRRALQQAKSRAYAKWLATDSGTGRWRR